MIINAILGINGADNPVLMSLFNAFVLCAALPLIGSVINFITDYGLGFLMNRFFRNSNAYYVFHNYITAPGVVIHELSHLLVAIVTLCKIEKVELFKPKGDQLGGVEYRPRGTLLWTFVQMTLVSCAPVVSGIFITTYLITWLIAGSIPTLLVPFAVYMLVCVILHMNMSGQDIKIYVRGVWVFFLVFFVYSLYVCKNYV